MNPLQFTIRDFQTPEALERLFRRLNIALQENQQATPAPPDIDALALKLAPIISTQLTAPGESPLNLQSLLPASGSGVVLEDTHANRLTLYPPANYAVGTLFWETDRTVLYVITSSSGSLVWTYAAGMYSSSFANRATDLGTNDLYFLMWVSTYNHIMKWGGTAWVFADSPGGYFADFAVAPAAGVGWVLCDGGATTYLAISGADLAETAFTTPDENTAPAGVYHESIAAYTGVINAAAAPGISGSVANTTATNNATTATNQAAVVDAHAVIERLDAAGAGIWLFDAQADADHASHNHTQDSHNHTQNAHNHAVGTLAVDATGEPRRMGVLRYFRT